MGIENIPPVDPSRVPPVTPAPDAGDVLRKQQEVRAKLKQHRKKQPEESVPEEQKEDDDRLDVLA